MLTELSYTSSSVKGKAANLALTGANLDNRNLSTSANLANLNLSTSANRLQVKSSGIPSQK